MSCGLYCSLHWRSLSSWANELAPDVVQDVERQVFDEALLGALRIAGLVRHSQSLFPKTDFPLDLDQRFDIERLLRLTQTFFTSVHTQLGCSWLRNGKAEVKPASRD